MKCDSIGGNHDVAVSHAAAKIAAGEQSLSKHPTGVS
jgi:hypothetical protein